MGDFNGDGKLDLAVANYASNTVGVLLGNGSGGFAAAVTYSSGGIDPCPWPWATSTATASSTLPWPTGQQHGGRPPGQRLRAASPQHTTFSTGGTYPESVAVGDFNGDGKLDLAVANYASNTVGDTPGQRLGRIRRGHDFLQRRIVS